MWRVGDVTESIDHDRRRFLGKAVMTLAASHLSVFGSSYCAEGASRELAAIDRATEWINSPRLTASSLAGRLVVVDFWTYTCINWLRTLPYVRAWSRKYAEGLVVIGVHTPEFGFEHDVENVRRAVRQMAVDCPVVIDNEYSIWRAFDNHYWPALYFIDARGKVRDHQFGEGEYERSEKTIQRLLSEAGARNVSPGFVSVEPTGFEVAADWDNLKSPESYVGYERAENLASSGRIERGRRSGYDDPMRLGVNE